MNNLRKTLKTSYKMLLSFSIIATSISTNMFDSLQTASVTAIATVKPNLLFLMTDQQRFDTLSRSGNQIISTPNLDTLANSGAYFEKAYTVCPVCAPARASIFTGTSPANTKITDNTVLSATTTTAANGYMSQKTYDEVLSSNGYFAQYEGKWHSPVYRASIYNTFTTGSWTNGVKYSDFESRYKNYLKSIYGTRTLLPGEQLCSTFGQPYIPNLLDPRYGKPSGTASGSQPDDHGLLKINASETESNYFTNKAIIALDDAMKAKKSSGKPFTVTLSINEPHAPMVLPSPYYGMYPTSLFTAPASMNDPMNNSPYVNSNSRLNLPEYRDASKIKIMMSDYYGIIKKVDYELGRIIQHLKDIGEYNNTLIVFTSDHGEMLGAHGMREKNVFYEESLHIPLIISFPGKIAANTVVSEPVSNLDIYSTILDYLAISPQPSNSKSLRPLIEKTSSGIGYVVSEWGNDTVPTLCITTTDWKLMVATKSGVLSALYDLKNDPNEMNNLIGNNPNKENSRSTVESLKKSLVEYLTTIKHPRLNDVKSRDIITGVVSTTQIYYSTSPAESKNLNILVDTNVNNESYSLAVTIGGIASRKIPANKCLYFKANDSVVNGSTKNLLLKVRYYDTGSDSLIVQYSSTDNSAPNPIYKNLPTISKKNTNTWKTVTYTISDAKFTNLQNNSSDFRISASNGNDYISKVEIVI